MEGNQTEEMNDADWWCIDCLISEWINWSNGTEINGDWNVREINYQLCFVHNDIHKDNIGNIINNKYININKHIGRLSTTITFWFLDENNMGGTE